jgi:hypothetical protein
VQEASAKLVDLTKRASALAELDDAQEAKLREVELSKMRQLLDLARSEEQALRVGLVWAIRLAEHAQETGDVADLDAALFRFGQYLRRAASQSGGEAASAVLAAAAHGALRGLLRPPQSARKELASGELSASVWTAVLGLSESEYMSAIDAVAQALRPTGPSGPNGAASAGVSDPLGRARLPPPTWLGLPPATASDPTLLEIRAWPDPSPVDFGASPRGLVDDAFAAWRSFIAGQFQDAEERIGDLRSAAGREWHLDESTEAQHLWTWLRLVHLLAGTDHGSALRLRDMSVVDLAKRLGFAGDGWDGVDERVRRLVAGLSWHEPSARTEATALTARLAVVTHHEELQHALGPDAVPLMRQAWRERFGHLGMGSKTSLRDQHQLIEAELRTVSAEARALTDHNSRADSRRFFPLWRRAEPFLTPSELRRLTEVRDLLAATSKMAQEADGGSVLAPSIDGLLADIAREAEEVRATPSALLHELLLPAITSMRSRARAWRDEVAVKPRPMVRCSLETRVLPLWMDPGEQVDFVVEVANTGGAPALSLCVSLQSSALSFADSSKEVAEIRPGATLGIAWQATLTSRVASDTIQLTVSYLDEYEQRFQDEMSFAVESERTSAWTDQDHNPFTGHAVRREDDLVGRSMELRTLRDWALSGTSCYLTGQKRVGKTSIARVHLDRLAIDGVATRYLPLGRTGAKSGNPADLMIAITERVSEAVAETWPDLDIATWTGTGTAAEASRSAGRWFEHASDRLDLEHRVVLVLDDFDELPSRMYQGDEAEELFTFLRPAFDEPWLSIVFVGSEVLPTIMSSQSIKWNLVESLGVSNFRSTSDTSGLLSRRSAHRLEWDDAAVELLHSVTAGNPFYIVRIASLVWQSLRAQGRAYVQVYDVQHAVGEYLSRVEPADFQHFWSDSRLGVDPSSDVADTSALVLRAVGRCIADSRGGAPSELVLSTAAELGGRPTGSQLAPVLTDLLERKVVWMNADDAVGIRVPLFASWLRDAGDRILDTVYHHQQRGRVSKWSVRPGDIVELCSGLYYQNEHVNEIRVSGWLEGFGSDRFKHLAFQLLQRLVYEGYFRSDSMSTHWSALAKEVRKEFLPVNVRYGARDDAANLFILEFGGAGSSGRGTPAAVRTSFKVRKSNIIGTSDLVEAVSAHDEAVVLVLDDFIGSGETVVELLSAAESALDGWTPLWRERVRIVVGSCVADASGLEAVCRHAACAAAVTARPIDARLRAFDTAGEIFESSDDREDMRALVEEIGRELVPRHPLGWDEQGLLVGFERNFPNNTLPIFWCRGRYHGRKWTPLFPRTS